MNDTNDDRPTQPPSNPITEAPPEAAMAQSLAAMPPPGRIPKEAEHVSAETWAGYDENSFMHRATAAVIDGTNALLSARQNYDVEAIVQRQRVLFEAAIGPKLDKLIERVTKTEGDIKDLQALRTEFAAMKSAQNAANARMTQIEAALGLKPPTP